MALLRTINEGLDSPEKLTQTEIVSHLETAQDMAEELLRVYVEDYDVQFLELENGMVVAAHPLLMLSSIGVDRENAINGLLKAIESHVEENKPAYTNVPYVTGSFDYAPLDTHTYGEQPTTHNYGFGSGC